MPDRVSFEAGIMNCLLQQKLCSNEW